MSLLLSFRRARVQVGEALGGIVDLIDGIVAVAALCRRLTSLKRLCCQLWVLHLDSRRRQDESLKRLGRLVGVNALLRLGRVVRSAHLVLQRRVVLQEVLVQLIVGLGAAGTLLTGSALILLLWLLDEGLLHLLSEGRCLALVGLLVLLDLLSAGVLLLQRGRIPPDGIVGTVRWTTTSQQCLKLGNDLQMDGQLSDVGLWHRLKLLLLLLESTEHTAEGIGEGIVPRRQCRRLRLGATGWWLVLLALTLALALLILRQRLCLDLNLLLVLEQLQDRPEQVELLLGGAETGYRRRTRLDLVQVGGGYWLLLLLSLLLGLLWLPLLLKRLLRHHHHPHHRWDVELPLLLPVPRPRGGGGGHGVLEGEGRIQRWMVRVRRPGTGSGSGDGGGARRSRSPGRQGGVAAGAVTADVVAGSPGTGTPGTGTTGHRRSLGLGPGPLPLGLDLPSGPLGPLPLLPLVLAILLHLGLVPDGVGAGHGLVPLQLGDADVLPPFGNFAAQIAERHGMLRGGFRLLPFHGVERSGQLGGIFGLSLAFAFAFGLAFALYGSRCGTDLLIALPVGGSRSIGRRLDRRRLLAGRLGAVGAGRPGTVASTGSGSCGSSREGGGGTGTGSDASIVVG